MPAEEILQNIKKLIAGASFLDEHEKKQFLNDITALSDNDAQKVYAKLQKLAASDKKNASDFKNAATNIKHEYDKALMNFDQKVIPNLIKKAEVQQKKKDEKNAQKLIDDAEKL